MVKCSPLGVAWRADIDLAVSIAASLPLVVPIGINRQPWIPDWAHAASEDALWLTGCWFWKSFVAVP